MSDIGSKNSKQNTMDAFLAEGRVLVQLDSRVEGVQVPDHLRGDPALRLNISGRFGLPLEVDDIGIHATLTFQGDPFECELPWTAVYILISHVTGEPCLFPDDVPPEYVSEALGHIKNFKAADPQPQPQPQQTVVQETPPRSHLRLVNDEPSSQPHTTIEVATPTPEIVAPPEPAVPLEALATDESDEGPQDDDPNDDGPPPTKKPFLSVVK